jgi:hypothetical protein
MQTKLNEGMKRCHQDNGFQDQLLLPLLPHQLIVPIPISLISLDDLRGIIWSSKTIPIIIILGVPIALLSFKFQLLYFCRK